MSIEQRRRRTGLGASVVAALCLLPGLAKSQESLCATVKIEIVQELTLERQAFDARMRIDNGLDTFDLENVNVDVLFMDEDENPVVATSDPNDTTATFFIRIDSLDGISDASGGGTVAATTDAEIHWLIIPAPGAAEGQLQGKLYQVGARLSYTLGGEEQTVEVVPDTITVKPQPVLALDYFLEQEVYADDAFTPQVEPAEPFTLGVRIQNEGSGAARTVKIDSAQPRITENELGLLIGFEITGSFVNDEEAQESLLIDFGDIEPNEATVGRWLMETTLSGEFTDFSAEFSHADELGGAVTSQIDRVDAHLLVHDVRVDLPGRDSVRDFLADDGDVLRVYESDGVDTVVDDLSATTSLSAAGGSGSQPKYAFTVAPTPGMLFVKLPDPLSGAKGVLRVVRSDGKVLPARNGWASKTRNGTTFDHFVNVFDADGGGTYTITLADRTLGPEPPVLQFVADRSGIEGDTVSFIVEASDPNETIPALAVDALPVGATFVDGGSGLATFTWPTTSGQAGTYPLVFRASDGVLEDSQVATVRLFTPEDTDGDGMDDDWEIANFGDLSRDGTGDADGDGISDLDEFLNGTDPNSGDQAPGVPVIASPLYDEEVLSLLPTLVLVNSDHGPDPVTYEFEVWADEAMTVLTDSITGVPEDLDQTSWTVAVPLDDNTLYYWRARATDGIGTSEWVNGRFFVNTANDLPGLFEISAPEEGLLVDTFTPLLEVTNSVDVDRDPLVYDFAVFLDPTETLLVASTANVAEDPDGSTSWTVDTSLAEDTWYYWGAVARDDEGAETESPQASFFVSTVNDGPPVPAVLAPVDGAELDVTDLSLVVANAPDPEMDPVRYFFEIDTVDTFDSGSLQISPELVEGIDETEWPLTGLSDDTRYYWRAKATDGDVDSDWALASFFVNTANDPPSTPTVSNPGDGAWVELLQPTLSLNAAMDSDEDTLSYGIELYADPDLLELVSSATVSVPAWVVDLPLDNHEDYYWRSRARDEHGEASAWSAPSMFFVNEDGVDDPPSFAFDQPTGDLTATGGVVEFRWTDADPDSNATIELLADGVPFATGLAEDPDGESEDRFFWSVSGLPEGAYAVAARISDDTTSVDVPCCTVTVPAGTPGISVTPLTTLETDEAGTFATSFLVSLEAPLAPGAQLSIPLSLSSPAEAEIVGGLTELVFEDGNADQPQVVFLKGLDDCEIDGDQSFTVVVGTTTSDDPNFDALDPPDLVYTNLDNETPGQQLFICEYELVDQRPVGGGPVVDFDYRALLESRGTGITGADASLTVLPSHMVPIGSGDLTFPVAGVGETVPSLETFTLRFDPATPFDPAKLTWTIDAGEVTNVVQGTNGNDLLQGTDGRDTLQGLKGKDTLWGGAGNDVLDGGLGDDVMYGEDGDDVFLIDGVEASRGDLFNGGGGFDIILGGQGDDTIIVEQFTGDDRVERIDGGLGTNVLSGSGTQSVNNLIDLRGVELVNIARVEAGKGADTVYGTSAGDVISGGLGDDSLFGEAGDDVFLIHGTEASRGDLFNGGLGFDLVQGGDADDNIAVEQFVGDDRVERIDGGGGTNVLSGSTTQSVNNTIDLRGVELVNIARVEAGKGADTVYGTGSGDVISGGPGDDTLFGEAGDDVFVIEGTEASRGDRFVGGDGFDTVRGGAGDDVIAVENFVDDDRVERIDGGAGTNVLSGSTDQSVNNTIDLRGVELLNISVVAAGKGADTVYGTGLSDVISGGPGDDVLYGEAGDDVFRIEGTEASRGDQFAGGDGFDTVLGGAGDDVIAVEQFTGDDRVERIDGGAGTNVLSGSTDQSVNNTIDLRGVELLNIARVEGGKGADTVYGTALADVISGGPGDDVLYGEAGDDVFPIEGLEASRGDQFVGGDGFDTILGGAGDDTIVVEQFTGDNRVERIDGGAGTNVISGSSTQSVNNTIDLRGVELLHISHVDGGKGKDTIHGTELADVIEGGKGDDSLYGEGGDDVFPVSGTGAARGDVFNGGDGFDVVLGGDGNDTIVVENFTGDDRVERIDGGLGDNVLSGSGTQSVNNTIDLRGVELLHISHVDGGKGKDTIHGTELADVIEGGKGDDSLYGEGGDDVFVIEGTDASRGDLFHGGPGFDVVRGGSGDDTIIVEHFVGDDRVERIDGGPGVNVLSGSGTQSVNNTIDLRGIELLNLAHVDAGKGADTVYGTDFADVIVGGAGDDVLRGEGGDDVFPVNGMEASRGDTFTGGDGFDVVRGGDGHDTIVVDQFTGDDRVERIDGGAGVDILSGSGTQSRNNTIDLTGVELWSIESIDLGKGQDTLFGSDGDDVIVGGSGADLLYGAGGDDVYAFAAGHGADRLQDQGSVDTDVARFSASADPADFWVSRSGDDLVFERVGTSDNVVLVGWWGAVPDRIARFELDGGPTLHEADVQALVDALAPYSPDEALSPEDQAIVDAAISAAWE